MQLILEYYEKRNDRLECYVLCLAPGSAKEEAGFEPVASVTPRELHYGHAAILIERGTYNPYPDLIKQVSGVTCMPAMTYPVCDVIKIVVVATARISGWCLNYLLDIFAFVTPTYQVSDIVMKFQQESSTYLSSCPCQMSGRLIYV